jgi:hypothetical protein
MRPAYCQLRRSLITLERCFEITPCKRLLFEFEVAHAAHSKGFMLRRFGLPRVSMRSDRGFCLEGPNPAVTPRPMKGGQWQAGTAGATHSACIPSSFAQ